MLLHIQCILQSHEALLPTFGAVGDLPLLLTMLHHYYQAPHQHRGLWHLRNSARRICEFSAVSPKNLTCFYTYSASCKVMKPFCLHLGQWAIYLCFSQCCTTTIKRHINIEDCGTCETVLEGSVNSLPCHQRTSHAFTHTVHLAKS